MKFQSKVTVLGMKASKGDFEGTAFDSTKAYVLTALDESKGSAKGAASAEYTYGDSSTFERFKGQAFPFEAEATFELVTTGKVQKTVLLDLKPINAKAAA